MGEKRGDWREDAACRGNTTVDWFPVMDHAGGTTREWRDNLARAREVCDGCPVKVHCLNEAMDDPLTDGIWAGTSRAERLRGPKVRRHAPCGTEAGYRGHKRRGEDACASCLAANASATYQRKWRRRLAERSQPDPSSCPQTTRGSVAG